MNYKKIFVLILLFFLTGCETINNQNKKKITFKVEDRYQNSGFALIYDQNFDNKMKKIDERSLDIYHKTLAKKSSVKITNPANGNYLIARVKSNKVNFSFFYNSVISKRIAEDLELDENEPFIEILLLSKDSTFIAKKAKTFDEEKEVANKAPIDGIQINDLNVKKLKKKKTKEKSFSYSIKLADFYYKDTAKMMINRIKNETFLKDYKIIQLSKTKYRVIIGPFNDISSLKNSFEEVKTLNFENIEILNND